MENYYLTLGPPTNPNGFEEMLSLLSKIVAEYMQVWC